MTSFKHKPFNNLFPFTAKDGIAQHSVMGTPYEPLARGARDIGLVVGFIQKHTSVETEPTDVLSKPRLYIVGDDLETAEGQEAFHPNVLEWVFNDAHDVILHMCKGEALHYGLAASMALMFGKVVLIESQVSKEHEWKSYVSKYASDAQTHLIAAGWVH